MLFKLGDNTSIFLKDHIYIYHRDRKVSSPYHSHAILAISGANLYLNVFPLEVKGLAYVHTHATCDMRRATYNCDIFAAIILSYSVHTLATCDMQPQRATCDRDKFAHVAILSHVA